METKNRKGTILKQDWFRYLGVFVFIQLFFIVFDRTPPKYREGTLLTRLSESVWFTENFAPYETPEFNVLTVFFAIIFLPTAFILLLKSKK